MSDFVIIPDSACDLSAELREQLNIPDYLRGIVYCPYGTQMMADMDWKDITPDEYFDSMNGRDDVLYKTAFSPVEEMERVLVPILEDGKDILIVTLSSGIFGTYQASITVSKQLMEKYPGRKIICVDSLRYSQAIGVLLYWANEKRKQGATIEETAEYLNELRHRVCQMGPLDNLLFCVKTGRISNMKAILGTMVGVHCMASFSRDGLPEILGKVKGKQAALRATFEYVKETIVNPEEQVVFISHSSRYEYAKELAEKIRTEIKPKEVYINSVGMSCGSSIGPGLIAVFYLGNEISKDNEKEKQLLQQIYKKVK